MATQGVCTTSVLQRNSPNGYTGGVATRRAPSPEERAVGERLKQLRKARGLRVCDVSRRLDMSDHNYMWYEEGRNIVKALMIRPLAEVLGMHPHDLHDHLYPVIDDHVEEVANRFNCLGSGLLKAFGARPPAFV